MTIPSSRSLILWISVFSITSPSADFGRLRKTSDVFGRLRTSLGIFGNDRVVFKNPSTPTIKISRLHLRKSWQVYKNGYSLPSRYFPIHSKEKTNKRLDETRINENFCQYSFLSLVHHFLCFENGHRHGDHVMVGDVDHCFRFFKNWHTPEL